MKPDTLVLKILQDAVKDVLLVVDFQVPVKFTGVSFDVQANPFYLELVHIPNDRTGDYWDETKVYQGLFRLILHKPNDGTGAYEFSDQLSEIAGWFDKNKALRKDGMTLRMYKVPDVSGVLELGSELQKVATISYRGKYET